MKRRIIFHDPRLAATSGGGETLTLRTISALDQDKFDITILTRGGISSPLLLSFLKEHQFINVVEVDASNAGCDEDVRCFLRDYQGSDLWGKDRLVDDGIRFNAAAAAHYRKTSYDLASFTVLTDLFGLEVNGRAAFHIYGSPPVAMADGEGPLLRQVGAVSAVSHFIRDQVCAIMSTWIEAGSVEILPPGIPPAFLTQPPKPAPRDVDFAFAGRLVPRKGVDIILHALAELGSTHGLRPTVVVAGDGPMKEALLGLCNELGLKNQVNFAGPLTQDQLIALLDRARWFLYPVRKPEAFGLGPLEAMARGVPAIVGELGGMADYLDSTHNGYVLAECDAKLLAARMLQTCRDPNLRDQLAPNCWETAARFSWETFAQRVNAFFDKACAAVS